jgi:hypothetical protein
LFSDKDIDEILEMCSRATPGPWEAEHGEWDCDWECGKKPSDPPCYKEIGECEHIRLITPAGVSGTFTVECGDYAGLSNEDAQFIASARNLLPALAESWLQMAREVERLRIYVNCLHHRKCTPEYYDDNCRGCYALPKEDAHD